MSNVLIHIGFPKTGSTYLQKWFSEHPEMYYKSRGIAGFYNAHEMATYAQKTQKIHSVFVLSSEDLSVWKGDEDTIGSEGKIYDTQQYQRNLCETLHRIFPNGKMLIVTRGYAGMLPSLYSQFVRGGGVLTFDELQDTYGKIFKILYDYTWIVKLYRERFGSENVIVLPYELLRDAPDTFTSLLESEMGITEHFSFSAEKINAAMDPVMITAYRRFSKFLFTAIQPLGSRLSKKIYRYHAYRLIYRHKHPLIEFTARFVKEPEKIVIADWLIESFKGGAEIFGNEKLYQPYLKEYLL